MSIETVITALPTSFVGATDRDRARFVEDFHIYNDAQSSYFNKAMRRFATESGIDTKSIRLISLLNAFYVNYVLCMLARDHSCVIFADGDDLALEFALGNNQSKHVHIVTKSKSLRQRLNSLDGYDLSIHDDLPSLRDACAGKSVQQVVSINSVDHENALANDLLPALATTPFFSMIVHGHSYQWPRSGPKVRELYRVRATAEIDVTEPDQTRQYFAAVSLYY